MGDLYNRVTVWQERTGSEAEVYIRHYRSNKETITCIVHVSRLYLHVHVLYACDGFFIVPVVSDVYSCTSASVEQSSLASQALVEGRVEPGTHCLRMRENLWNRASNEPVKNSKTMYLYCFIH